jgi:hypothetical protein
MGARPMARLIQDTVRRALADELLFGKLVHGGKVTIDIDPAEKVVLRFEEQAPRHRRGGRTRRLTGLPEGSYEIADSCGDRTCRPARCCPGHGIAQPRRQLRHLPRHRGPRVTKDVIPLAGLPKEHIVAQLQAFRDGKRPAPVMHQIAKGYTDAQMNSLAGWFAAQKR